MMGVPSRVFWASWFLTAAAKFGVVVACTVAVLVWGAVLPAAAPSVLLVFFGLFRCGAVWCKRQRWGGGGGGGGGCWWHGSSRRRVPCPTAP
jgi:hypothetical protein